MNLKTIQLAKRDISQAAAYYRAKRIGLDEEFLQEVEKAISAIAASPYRCELIGRTMRRYILDRFPYSICYRVRNPESIEIVVVKHHSRRPGFGMHRK